LGSFPSKSVGANLTVTTSSVLSGVSSPNYILTEPTGLTASITPKAIIEINAQTFSKTYDGTRTNVGYTSTLRPTENVGTGTYTDGTAYTGDGVTITSSANFVAKDVTPTGAISSTSVITGVDASNYSLTVAVGLTPQAITKKNVTMFGLNVVSPKIYDGTLSSTVINSPGSLQTPEAAGTGTTIDGKPYDVDVITLSGTASGTYNTKDVATATSVTFSGLSLTGAQAGNYSLTIQTPANATIIPKALTFSGLSVPLTKVYDGTTSAVVSPTGSSGTLQTSIIAGTGSATDGKPYTVDLVSLTGTPTANYNARYVATANTVSFTGVSLTGAQSSNYTLTAHPTQAATITPKVIIEINAQTFSKTYDGTTVNVNYTSALKPTENIGTGTYTDGTAYTGDGVTISSSANFVAKDVSPSGTISSTSIITGADASNYSLTVAVGLTPRAITKKNLTMYGLTVANSKIYDGTLSATVINSPGTLQNTENGAVGTSNDGKPYNGDDVSLTGNAIGTYNSKYVPTATTVTYSAISLTGAQSGNYSLTIQTPANATITPKALTFSGLSVPLTKVYDASTSAVVSPTGSSGILQTSIAAGTGTATDGKPYTGDVVNLSGTPIGTYNAKNVLTANTVAFTNVIITGAQASSYSLTAHNNQTATIIPKPIDEIEAITKEKVYDATLLDVGYTSKLRPAITPGTGTNIDGTPYTGDAVVIKSSATFSVKDVITSGAISSTSTLSGNDSSNYLLTKAVGLASNNITRKQLTMSGLTVPTTKIYDGTISATVLGKATLQDAENPGIGSVDDGKPYIGDIVGIAGTPVGVYDFKDVPMASAVAYSNLNLSGSQSGNYTLKIQDPSIARITSKKLNMQGLSVADSKTYDGNTTATVLGTPSFLLAEDPGTGNTLDGKPYVGDVINIVGVPTATYNSKNVVEANKVTFAGLSIAGLLSYNYALNIQNEYPAKIVPLNLKVNADSQTKVYGDEDPTFTYTNDSLIYGDQFTGSLSRTAGQNVGSYVINVGTLDLGKNYVINFNPNNLIITEAPISIKPDTTFRIYGDVPLVDGTLTNNFKITGLKYKDILNSVKLYFPKGVGTGNDKKDTIGIYPNVVLAKYFAEGTALSSNYKIISFPGDIKIKPLPISIKADAKQKRNSEPDPKFTYTLQFPLVNGDTISGLLIRDTGEIPGTYLINQGTLAINNNYSITYEPDFLTILTVVNIFVVPTGFTPNGDNKNDYVRMLTTNVDRINYFKIFNRAGKLIYETHDLNDKWDGRVNGVLQDADAYYWIAEYVTWDRKILTSKGSFILLK
jgi:gliding motility-associated-like protein